MGGAERMPGCVPVCVWWVVCGRKLCPDGGFGLDLRARTSDGAAG